ncbi:hypothetical protein AB7M33_005075 [Pseudomonas sp. Y3 TE3536]
MPPEPAFAPLYGQCLPSTSPANAPHKHQYKNRA